MKKSLFITSFLILLHFFTFGCNHHNNITSKTDGNIFDVKSKHLTTNDFIILTKRLLNQVAADDYFKDNPNEIILYFERINNNLIDDNDSTNRAIKDIVLNILGSLDNIYVTSYRNDDAFYVEMKYFISEISYSKWQKPTKALNANLYLYDHNHNEIKAWNDYLIKSEDFNLWQ